MYLMFAKTRERQKPGPGSFLIYDQLKGVSDDFWQQ